MGWKPVIAGLYKETEIPAESDPIFAAWLDTSPLSGYVPYTGASSDVDLGAQNLTTTGAGTFGTAGTVGLNVSGRTLIGGATDDTTSALQVHGDITTDGIYYGDGSGLTNTPSSWVGTAASDLDMSTYAIKFASGGLITDSTYNSIDPYNRILYASDGSTSVLNWASGRALFNGATDDYSSALQVNGQIYSNTGLSVGGLPDYGQLLWLNGGGSGTEAVARLNNIDGTANFDATAAVAKFRFGYNQSYWVWAAGFDHSDNDDWTFKAGGNLDQVRLKLLQGGGVLIPDRSGNLPTDDTTSDLQVAGTARADGDITSSTGGVYATVFGITGGNSGYTGALNDSTSTQIADVEGGIITAVYY